MAEQHGGTPRPERINPTFERLFNVDAMSDEEIIWIYRGVKAVADAAAEEGFEKAELGDNLLDRLALEVGDLAARDPQRVKGLVNRCAMSGEEADQTFAVTTAGSLVHYDYEFTRDTLLCLHYDPDHTASGVVAERSMFAIQELMHDHLSPEQVEDFNAQLVRLGHDPL